MRPAHRAFTRAIAVAALGAAVYASAPACAAEPLALRQIMRDLNADAQAITGGLSQEDYGLVARAAQRIAEHPRPPLAERARLVAFMGDDMSKFKRFDGETHEAATAVATAALQGDGQAAIDDFRRLQTACLRCHQAFRKPITAHFYGTGE